MANSLLTPTAVTREALRILHQKLNFIGNINRQYDDSFAQSGAKIGDSLKIRLPNQYTVRTGRTIQIQDTAETSVTLQVATQKGVDMAFTSADLTLSLDDFSKRILQPAMSVLAASIEADALSMYKDVYNQVEDATNAITFAQVLNGRKILVDNLTPMGDEIYCCLDTQANVDLVDILKGLFHDDKEVSMQYRDGYIGRTAGMMFSENTLLPLQVSGTAIAGDTTYNVNGANQTGAAITVDTGSTTFLKGDVITFASVFRVHPETKVSTGILQQFAITADSGASATSLAISPSLTTSGAKQNVTVSPANASAVSKTTEASEDYALSLAHHRDAFAFATADLVMPKGVDFSAREVMDEISMRIVRQYDINNDNMPTRIDVLYGFKTIRPELAVRLGFN